MAMIESTPMAGWLIPEVVAAETAQAPVPTRHDAWRKFLEPGLEQGTELQAFEFYGLIWGDCIAD